MIDTVTVSDCKVFMQSMEPDSVNLVVTSPPYAKQRDKNYGGIPEEEFPQWLSEVGQEIRRVLKPSGSFMGIGQIKRGGL